MKKIILLALSICFSISLSAQRIALKNNLIYDATLTPNLSLEIGMGPRSTLDLGFGYNPFTFDGGKKIKHLLAQPEIRFWSCERFNGFFWGIHLHGGIFNLSGVKMPFGQYPNLKDNRYEGYAMGGGVSIGNQWVLGRRWNLEASIGAGYVRAHYDRYECRECGNHLGTGNKNYFGITKATISFVYLLK